MDRPCAAFWLLMASLASPALAAETGEEAPPWAVEAPGAAGARFGLGLDLFFERQESLRITFQEQALRSLDPSTGNEVSTVVRTDPGLLNRKFDLEWNLTGLGIQPAIALPLPRTLGLHPTVVLQAASADVSLDFLDRNRPEDSSSLDGRGSLFGAGLDLTRAFCEGCPWFAGVSYFSQRIPGFTVDRAPPFGLEGFEILDDEVQLRRDVQEVSSRVGYGFSGNRIVSYVGVRHLRTDVEIEDRLRYRDPFLVETSLSSRTKLESEVTLASAGVEARLGPRLFGRLETSVGEEDWGAFLRVVYLPGLPDRVTEEPERLTNEQASSLAGQIREIRNKLSTEVDRLPEIVELDLLLTLLNRTERDLLALLPFPDFAALYDSIRDSFQTARERLMQTSAARASGPDFMYAVLRMSGEPVAAIQPAAESRRKQEATPVWSFITSMLLLLEKRFENNDIEVTLCVMTVPLDGAEVDLYPLSNPKGGGRVQSNRELHHLRRGLYAYKVKGRQGFRAFQCPANDSERCRLDLLLEDFPFVECTMVRTSEDGGAGSCIVKSVQGGECK